MIHTDIWKFFDRKVLLTQIIRRSGKPSRFPTVMKELNRVGISDVHVFEALDAIGPHQSFTLSQKQMLTDFIKSDAKVMLTLEDDVEFHDLEPLHDAIDDIQRNKIKWDVLYLGGNIVQGRVLEKRRHICRVADVWTTHAVAYNRFAAASLLEHFPHENEVMYDTYLGSMNWLFKSYMVNPMVAVQRPDYSDIWGHNVNYLNIFQESNKKMK